MADTKISAATAVTTAAATDEYATNQGGTAKRTPLSVLIAFFSTILSGNSGTANANVGAETWQVLSSNASSNSTTTIADVLTTNTLQAGTYWFRYDIIAQSGATTTAHKFRVNFSGTVTRILWHLFFPSQGVTAATGVVDQAVNTTTGNVWAHESSRSNNATLGPMTDVDTINADVHYVIEGILVCSTSGNLALGHASEVAASSQVMAGTMLYLKRVA